MRRFLLVIFICGIFLAQTSAGFASKSPPPFWVSFGAPESVAESRFSTDGEFRPFPESFTVTPLIEINQEWYSRENVEKNFFFKEDCLPIPNTVWHIPDLRMQIEAFAWGAPDKSIAFVRYTLQNVSASPVKGRIYFLLTPSPGGKINAADYSEKAKRLLVNQTQQIYFLSPLTMAGFLTHSERAISEKIKKHELTQIHSVKDPSGKASGYWMYEFSLQAGDKVVLAIAVPFFENVQSNPGFSFAQSFVEASAFWRKRLQPIHLGIQDDKLQDALRLAMASLLMTRDQPGIYFDEFEKEEVWTQDVFKIIRAYLRYGMLEEANEDLEMIGRRMDPLGEIPPRMMEKSGEAPLKEYDLQGQFVAAVLETYQFSHDKTWLEAKWPLVKRTLDSLKQLRARRVTSWYASQNPEISRFYGILPPSNASHDTENAVRHRYADDLWALKAWKDGREIAEILGKAEETRAMEQEEAMLRRALFESIEKSAKSEDVNFIPEFAEKPFFNPETAALVVWPAEETAAVSSGRLASHFKNTMQLFEKAKVHKPSKAFRYADFSVIQALLREGKKEEALKLFRFQWENLRPADFNQAAGFAQTLRDFFVYEASDQLILGAGLLPEWINPKTGFQARIQTRFGEIAYDLTPSGRGYLAHVTGDAQPSGGFVLKSPKSASQQAFHRLPLDFQIE